MGLGHPIHLWPLLTQGSVTLAGMTVFGDGYGSSNGSGFSYGDGYGSGYGWGNGDGHGKGFGHGDGDGGEY